jgi:hypothetical protein
MDDDLIRKLRQRSKEWRRYADQLESTAQLIERLEGVQPTLFSKEGVLPMSNTSHQEPNLKPKAIVVDEKVHLWQIIKEILAKAEEPLTKEEILERMHQKGFTKVSNPKDLAYPLSRKSFFKTDGKGRWKLEEGALPI